MTTKPFADRLRAARSLRGMTQAKAAASLGAHRLTWVLWEGGKHVPRGMALRAAEKWIEKSKKGGPRA